MNREDRAPIDLLATMRAKELERRAARRLLLMQQIKNELALDREDLSPEHRAYHKLALEQLQASQLSFEYETSPGYWRRLWSALLNRP